MAKATRHGASIAPARVRRAELGRVDQSPGMDYSPPLSSETQSNERGTDNLLQPAQTTESPSVRTEQQGSSIVHSTDGDIQTTETQPYGEWSYPRLQAECRERGLSASGKSRDLVARLEENDQESEDDEDEDEDDEDEDEDDNSF